MNVSLLSEFLSKIDKLVKYNTVILRPTPEGGITVHIRWKHNEKTKEVGYHFSAEGTEFIREENIRFLMERTLSKIDKMIKQI